MARVIYAPRDGDLALKLLARLIEEADVSDSGLWLCGGLELTPEEIELLERLRS